MLPFSLGTCGQVQQRVHYRPDARAAGLQERRVRVCDLWRVANERAEMLLHRRSGRELQRDVASSREAVEDRVEEALKEEHDVARPRPRLPPTASCLSSGSLR